MAISWETAVGILFPVLMQILSNFLKKQRKVSMGCRSIPLKFKLNCLKAPVVMVSSPCFSVWEEWENDCLSKITKFQKKKTNPKQNCILCGTDLRSLKNRNKKEMSSSTVYTRVGLEHWILRFKAVLHHLRATKKFYMQKYDMCRTKLSKFRHIVQVTVLNTALPWISVLLPVALSNALRRDTQSSPVAPALSSSPAAAKGHNQYMLLHKTTYLVVL